MSTLKSIDSENETEQKKFEDFKEKNKEILEKWMKEYPKHDPPIFRNRLGNFQFTWPNRKDRRRLGIK